MKEHPTNDSTIKTLGDFTENKTLPVILRLSACFCDLVNSFSSVLHFVRVFIAAVFIRQLTCGPSLSALPSFVQYQWHAAILLGS